MWSINQYPVGRKLMFNRWEFLRPMLVSNYACVVYDYVQKKGGLARRHANKKHQNRPWTRSKDYAFRNYINETTSPVSPVDIYAEQAAINCHSLAIRLKTENCWHDSAYGHSKILESPPKWYTGIVNAIRFLNVFFYKNFMVELSQRDFSEKVNPPLRII